MVDTDDFPELARARALWAQGALDAALKAFDAAVSARPDNVKALLEAARAFGGRHEMSRAETLLSRAAHLSSEAPTLAAQVAVSYGRINREDVAIRLLEGLQDPSAPVRAELAALHERAGRLDAALQQIEACRDLAPDAAEPRLAHARILRRRGQGEIARPMLEELTRDGLAPAIRAEAWTELCYVLDRQGDSIAAAGAIDAAHAVLRALPEFPTLLERSRSNNRLIQRMARDMRAGTTAAWRRGTPEPDRPLAFLTGFPRSGTTLLEQCLDAHPQLVASPERVVFTRDILPRLCQAGGGVLNVATLGDITPERAFQERAQYLQWMEAISGAPIAGRVHLDKNPNHTGLIPALLRLDPHARLIIALRDPRDVITSCVLRTFRLTEFSAMLLDWGTACELYAAEMGAWLRYRERIPATQWVETRYEDMVADPMAEVRGLLPTLGLDWDPAIAGWRDRLDGKFVNSPTQTEVRQPIHAGAIGRWRAYARHLDPHMHVLRPFLEAFGYA